VKVLHVIPAIAPQYGGPSEAVISLVKALIKRDVNAVIATTDADGSGRLSVPLDELSEKYGVPVRFFPRQFSEAFKYSRTLARWLRAHVDDFDVVHIHAVFSHSSVAAFKACIDKGVPYLIRPLGTLDPTTLAHKAIRKKLFAAIWGRRMLSRAAGIHYSTIREKQDVEGSFNLACGFVLPIGVDIERHQEDSGQLEKPAPSFGHYSPYIIFLGRLDPIKNIEMLIDAFCETARVDALGDWHLLIAGDGRADYVESLKKRALRSSTGHRVLFPGWLSGAAKTDALANAELFALTSRHESFGRSVTEAMSLGTPVLIADDVFIADDVREYQAGWVVSGGLEELCRLLEQAISDGDIRQHRGACARRLVSDRFDSEQTADKMIQRYETVIG
jgi:glycosyltransferase involved in cell wall biosynthesis